jgi:hypothetical protein
MANRRNDFDHSLLQRDPGREAMLCKMRGTLAGTAAPSPHEVRRRGQARGEKWTWVVRIGAALGLVAINFLVLEKKDVLLASMGYEGVPSLPKPGSSLSQDEQALYYTYALYYYGKLRENFKIDGFYAIDQASARAKLDELMPKVSSATLSEISRYTPVAFRTVGTVGAGGMR